jgi:hypothetical protein
MNAQTFLVTLSGAIATGLMTSLPASALIFSNNVVNGTINNSGGTTFNISVSNISAPSVFSLNIGSISSSGLSGLDIYLQSPGNNQILLLGTGFQDGAFTNVTFRNSGAAIGNAPYNNIFLAPQTTANDPAGIANINSFSEFTPVNGTWSLFINSSNLSGSGSISSINLDVTPVPFEFSPALGVVGLGAVWAFKQAQKKK